MRKQLYANEHVFLELSPKWRNLLMGAASSYIFLTPQFLSVWWKYFGAGELIILGIDNEDKKLSAIFPLHSIKLADNRTQLSFLGDLSVSDYLDVIIPEENLETSWDVFEQFLSENQEWNLLDLISIPEASSTRKFLEKIALRQNWKYQASQQTVCPIITLPSSWDQYLIQVGKKQHHEIRRKWKNLSEAVKLSFSVIENGPEVSQAAEDFIRLHQLSSAEKASFWHSKLVSYFTDLIKIAAEEGWLKLYFLEVEGVRAATMLCFSYNNQTYVYNSGFDAAKFGHLGVGQVLISYTIQQAIELGHSRYDFLRGDEDYKFRFGAKPEAVFDIHIQRT